MQTKYEILKKKPDFYTRICNLEQEINMTDPYTGIAEDIGYFRAVGRCTMK